jgi:hypothetical protein
MTAGGYPAVDMKTFKYYTQAVLKFPAYFSFGEVG